MLILGGFDYEQPNVRPSIAECGGQILYLQRSQWEPISFQLLALFSEAGHLGWPHGSHGTLLIPLKFKFEESDEHWPNKANIIAGGEFITDACEQSPI